jgi:hypothetical protein
VLTNSTIVLFGMEQALCATTARLRVPCRVLSWPPILCAKSSRVCEAPAALNDSDGTRLRVQRTYVWESSSNNRRPRLEEVSIFLMITIAFPSRKGRRKKSHSFMMITTNNPVSCCSLKLLPRSQSLLKLECTKSFYFPYVASIYSIVILILK